jgi:hypothetical protein
MGASLNPIYASLLALSLMTGCSTISNVSDPRQIWCDTNAPRRDATETTPRAVLDEINAHNRRGAMWCGWKP